MSFYYYGINERELEVLLRDKELKIPKDYLSKISLFSLTNSLIQAIPQSTQNIYINKAKKIVVLKLQFTDEVSNHFHLRTAKKIKLENVVGYYIGENINKEDIYKLEASVLLSLEYENLLSVLDDSNEEDIYKQINIEGIDLVDMPTIMNKKKLDDFIDETFDLISNYSYYNYFDVI